MSIEQMLKEIMTRHPVPEALDPVHWVEPPPECRTHDGARLPCVQCAENEKRGYFVSRLLGRLANGFESDHGVLWHAVPNNSGIKDVAFCGAKPGRRSVGWSWNQVVGQAVTCPRCIKKLERISNEKK